MATGKALNGKPYAGKPHVRFDEGEVAPAATPRRGSLLYKLEKQTRLGGGCKLTRLLAAIVLPATCAAVDFNVEVDSPKIMSADESAVYYDKVYVGDDLTIDGADRGLTNSNSIVIGQSATGASATHPVTITVTNGAKWVVRSDQLLTFKGKGGTFVVSSPTAPVFKEWGDRIGMPIGSNYVNSVATAGLNTRVKIDSGVTAEGGVMDIARLLPNGTVSFRNIENQNSSVAARILFEGGTHWIQNNSDTRYTVSNGARFILESVDGNPIHICSLAGDATLFSGTGTFETRGDGDFVLEHNRQNANYRTITLSKDENGEIVWGHGGSVVLKGLATWKIGTDNILPYGPQVKPLVLSCPTHCDNSKMPNYLDLNGRTLSVNGLLSEGTHYKWGIVTNSVPDMGTLCLNVETNAILGGLLTASFATNAASNVKLRKIGSGRLTLTAKLPSVAALEVAGGMLDNYVGSDIPDGGNIVATNGGILALKAPFYNTYTRYNGFTPDSFVVDAGDGTATLSNVWQNALAVRSGTARIENHMSRIAVAEMPWRPVKSRIGAVTVDGGALDVAQGCLSSTNISVAAGAELRISGGGGKTNRVDFYTAEIADRYYRFIFKEGKSKKSFGLNHLIFRASDGSREFSPCNATEAATPAYSLNETAASAADLAAGQYMFSCPNGLTFVEETRSSGNCVYSKDGLSTRSSWGGVIINENQGLSLADPDTWVTLTIRLRDGAASSFVGYSLMNDWLQDKLAAWEVQASSDGTTWRTVDERRWSDIYGFSGLNNGNPTGDGYQWFNWGEPFSWRSLAADNVFNCEGSVQVDEGGVLDLSCVPDANISIKSVNVDAASGGGSIVKFRPAENGTLNITGIGGDIPARYTLPVAFPEAVDTARLATWSVTVDGEPSPATVLEWLDGVLKALTFRGTVISFR